MAEGVELEVDSRAVRQYLGVSVRRVMATYWG